MKIDDIIEAIRLNRVNITLHARKEAKEDLLKSDDIFFSTCYGEIIMGKRLRVILFTAFGLMIAKAESLF